MTDPDITKTLDTSEVNIRGLIIEMEVRTKGPEKCISLVSF